MIDITLVKHTSFDRSIGKLASVPALFLSGTREILAEIEPIVEREYAAAFATGGGQFGRDWTTARGRKTNLDKTGEFKGSFSRGSWRATVESGADGDFDVVIENDFRKPRMDRSFMEVLRSPRQGGIEVTGPIGGVSESGASDALKVVADKFSKSIQRAGFIPF